LGGRGGANASGLAFTWQGFVWCVLVLVVLLALGWWAERRWKAGRKASRYVQDERGRMVRVKEKDSNTSGK
jgi:membrane protein implicated in regulation of membrane protease activity